MIIKNELNYMYLITYNFGNFMPLNILGHVVIQRIVILKNKLEENSKRRLPVPPKAVFMI